MRERITQHVSVDREGERAHPVVAGLPQLVHGHLFDGEEDQRIRPLRDTACADGPPRRGGRAAGEAVPRERGHDPVVERIPEVQQARIGLGQVHRAARAGLHVVRGIEHEREHRPRRPSFAQGVVDEILPERGYRVDEALPTAAVFLEPRAAALHREGGLQRLPQAHWRKV